MHKTTPVLYLGRNGIARIPTIVQWIFFCFPNEGSPEKVPLFTMEPLFEGRFKKGFDEKHEK